MIPASFYHEFEANFRGTRDEIRKRLEVYLPFVQPLVELQGQSRAIDLGCGRGEWLELMRDTGLLAYGVDLDDGMLQDCRDRSLSVKKVDAVAHLRHLSNASMDIVSGFHIAEHLPFEELYNLISESFRVLRPGGLLILETPNAENISVGTLTFHMDPTHIRPLPPGLLSFLPKFVGFSRVKVLRLQESKPLLDALNVSLLDVIQGASPDFSIVAQKSANPEFLKKFDTAFARDYGLTLNTLSERYEGRITFRGDFDSFAARIEKELKNDREQVEKKLETQLAETHQWMETLQRELANYQERLINVYESSSWRVTAPLRGASILKSRISHQTRDWLRSNLRNMLRNIIDLTTARPRLRYAILRLLAPWPHLVIWLRRFSSDPSNHHSFRQTAQTLESELPPLAKRILNELKRQRSL